MWVKLNEKNAAVWTISVLKLKFKVIKVEIYCFIILSMFL